eukprot:1150874-Pelagomonas_calceolata.AAC.2
MQHIDTTMSRKQCSCDSILVAKRSTQLAGWIAGGADSGTGQAAITSISISGGMAAFVQTNGVLSLYGMGLLQQDADVLSHRCDLPSSQLCVRVLVCVCVCVRACACACVCARACVLEFLCGFMDVYHCGCANK